MSTQEKWVKDVLGQKCKVGDLVSYVPRGHGYHKLGIIIYIDRNSICLGDKYGNSSRRKYFTCSVSNENLNTNESYIYSLILKVDINNIENSDEKQTWLDSKEKLRNFMY